VKKVVSAAGIPAALEEALRWDNVALAEEMLTGMEVTCGVLGNSIPMALTPSETIPTSEILSLEDKFLYGQGENKTPARAPAEVIERIRQTAVAAFRALDLKVYSRIDMFVRENGSVAVLEPNSLPGMTPSTVLFHQAAESGISQTELISRIIDLSFEAHALKRGPL
jgi:D-alanine-D-alanine ligase